MSDRANRTLPAKDKSIAAAPFVGNGREVEYRIEGNPGLVLVVMAPKADGSITRVWRVYYSLTKDGKRTIRKVRIGAYPRIGLAEARRRAAEVGEDVERGKDVVAEVRNAEIEEQRQALTFSDLVGDYIAAQRFAGIKSVDDIERALRRDALPVIGAKAPTAVTDIDIEHTVDAVAKRGSKAMARHLLVYLRGVFNFALVYSPQLRAKYGLSSNPASFVGRAPRGRIGKYGRSTAKDRALDDREIAVLWPVLEGSGIDDATRTVIKLLILTGQRLGEVRGALIEELSLDGAEPTWNLPRQRTKNGEAHMVPLPPSVVALFRVAIGKRKRGPVFASELTDDGVLGDYTVRQAIGRFFETKADGTALLAIPRFTAHDLRRTVATGLGRIGVSDDTISRVLNHKKGDVTSEHYQRHRYEHEKRAAMDRWAEHVTRLVT